MRDGNVDADRQNTLHHNEAGFVTDGRGDTACLDKLCSGEPSERGQLWPWKAVHTVLSVPEDRHVDKDAETFAAPHAVHTVNQRSAIGIADSLDDTCGKSRIVVYELGLRLPIVRFRCIPIGTTDIRNQNVPYEECRPNTFRHYICFRTHRYINRRR